MQASAGFGPDGFVGIELTGEARVGAEVTLGFNTTSGPASDNLLTLDELLEGISDPLSFLALPDLQPLSPYADFGLADLTVGLSAGSADFTSLASGLLGEDEPRLRVQILSFGDPFLGTRFEQALYAGISQTEFKVNGDFANKLAPAIRNTGTAANDSTDTVLNSASAVENIEVGDLVLHETDGAVRVTEIISDTAFKTQLVSSGWSDADYTFITPKTLRFDGGQINDVQVVSAEFDGTKTHVIAIPSVENPSFEIPSDLTAHDVVLLPEFDIDTSGLGHLPDYSNFGFAEVIAALKALAGFLQQFEAFGFLDKDIPVIDKSVNDLLSVADDLVTALDELQQNPASTFQVLETKINEAFGIGTAKLEEIFDVMNTKLQTVIPESFDLPDDVFDLALDSSGNLKFDFTLGTSFTEDLSVAIPQIDFLGALSDIGLDGLFDLSGAANLQAEGAVLLRFTLGADVARLADLIVDDGDNVSLDDIAEHLFVYDTTALSAVFRAGGEDLSFRVGVGPFSLTIGEDPTDVNGPQSQVSITADASLVLDDTDASFNFDDDGKVSFADFFGDLTAAVAPDINAFVSGNLPVFFPNDTSPIGSIRFGGTDAQGAFVPEGDLTNLFDPPPPLPGEEEENNFELITSSDQMLSSNAVAIDVSDVVTYFQEFDFSKLNIFDNLLLGVDGLDLLLGYLEDLIDNSIGKIKLPVIGADLSKSADFIATLRDDLIGSVRIAVEELKDAAQDVGSPDLNQISKILLVF